MEWALLREWISIALSSGVLITLLLALRYLSRMEHKVDLMWAECERRVLLHSQSAQA